MLKVIESKRFMRFKNSISFFLICCVISAQVGFAVFEISCHCLGKHQISLLEIEDPCQQKKQVKKACCAANKGCSAAEEKAPCCPKKVKWVISDEASICSVSEGLEIEKLISFQSIVPAFFGMEIPSTYVEEEQYLRGPPLLLERQSQPFLQVFLC